MSTAHPSVELSAVQYGVSDTTGGYIVTLAEDNAALIEASGAKATDEMKAIYKTAQEHIAGEEILEKALGR